MKRKKRKMNRRRIEESGKINVRHFGKFQQKPNRNWFPGKWKEKNPKKNTVKTAKRRIDTKKIIKN